MTRHNNHARCTGFLALLLTLNLQDNASWRTGAWHRLPETPIIAPIISPKGDGWESAGTFNPAVVVREGKVIMLYRAQDKHGTSRLGYAESSDGLHFTRRARPVFSPEEPYEKKGLGGEDPRLVQFGDTHYLTYSAYNKKDAQLCLATSRDVLHWQRQGVILPAYRGNWNVRWTKSGAVVPEKIGGKYWMYFLGTSATIKIRQGWPIPPTSSTGQRPRLLPFCPCGSVNSMHESQNPDRRPSSARAELF
jgi:predicted GH43/DUF377 family glycosyl hydrolase